MMNVVNEHTLVKKGESPQYCSTHKKDGMIDIQTQRILNEKIMN